MAFPSGFYLLQASGQENPDHDYLQQAQTRKDCQDEHAWKRHIKLGHVFDKQWRTRWKFDEYHKKIIKMHAKYNLKCA